MAPWAQVMAPDQGSPYMWWIPASAPPIMSSDPRTVAQGVQDLGIVTYTLQGLQHCSYYL